MMWLLVCLVGLGLETGVIIVLGRQVTRRYESEAAGGPEELLRPARDATADRRAALLAPTDPGPARAP